MKSILFDLTLFGEGEGEAGGTDCAAEQSSANGSAVNGMQGEEGASEERISSVGSDAQAQAGEAAMIAELLGISANDTESLVAGIRARRARAELTNRLRKRAQDRRYVQLLSEADGLSSKYEGFDLKRELSDGRFSSLLRAGLSMEEAYRALHSQELAEEQIEKARKAAIAEAVSQMRAAADRPDENGAGGRAPAKSRTSVDGLTGRGIRDILRRVENGAKIKF